MLSTVNSEERPRVNYVLRPSATQVSKARSRHPVPAGRRYICTAFRPDPGRRQWCTMNYAHEFEQQSAKERNFDFQAEISCLGLLLLRRRRGRAPTSEPDQSFFDERCSIYESVMGGPFAAFQHLSLCWRLCTSRHAIT